LDSTNWDATASDLSTGGASISVPSSFPTLGRQDAFVVLETAVGALEVNGIAYSRPVEEDATRPEHSIARLIVEFRQLSATETAILASMLEAIREQSVAFSLSILLSAQTKTVSHEGSSIRPDHEADDRRESIRTPLSLPIRLECLRAGTTGVRLMARALNISRGGACVIVRASRDQVVGQVALHFAPAQSSAHPGPHEPGTPDSSLTAEVQWVTPDPTAPSEFRTEGSALALRIGIRFTSLTPFAERELIQLVRQHLSSISPPPPPDDRPYVVSVRRECRNHRGQAIAMMDDHLRQPAAAEMPILILVPGFGQTALDYAAFAKFAAHHRFRILRYDHTNHLGLSDGELQNTTVRGMQNDLAKVLEFVQHTWPSAPVVAVANDLSARAALKMAVHSRPFDLLFLVNPILDVSAHLMSAHGHDLLSDYQYGLRRGVANLFGFNVNIDQFVGDLIAGRMTNLSSSLEDIRLLRTSLCLVATPLQETNPLAPANLPHAVMTALDQKTRVLSLPTPLAIQDFTSAQPHYASFRQILEHAASQLSIQPLGADPPSSSLESMEQRGLEREYLRLHRNVSQISRDALAIGFSQQLPSLANVHVYRKLLDDLYAFLSPLQEGMEILDTGLGQSELSRALLVNHTYRTRQRGLPLTRPPLLIGLRSSSEVIQRARQDLLALQRELISGTAGVAAISSLALGWVQGNWSTPLPIRALSIHRLVSNISLSFVASPRETIIEWYRVLQPGGRAVFTVLHPLTDLSQLYRRHLRLANQDEFVLPAQQVLHYMGRLREAICHGIVHVFDRASLTALLRQLPQASFRVSPILNGQALAVVIEKAQIL
jgi:SAM-dependent methyltransferase